MDRHMRHKFRFLTYNKSSAHNGRGTVTKD